MNIFRSAYLLILLFVLSSNSYANTHVDSRIVFIEKMNTLIERAKSRNPQRYNIFPNSLIISQIILESGWGTSRLAKRYNNLLGLKNGSKFATFNSYVSSIQYYFDNLLTHDAYSEFRSKLQNNASVKTLIVALSGPYSGNEKTYAKQLRIIIKQYNLERYDD